MTQKAQKTILTYGSFDLFHIGHLKLIERLRMLGDRLIIGVSTDEFNTMKGKSSIIPFDQRAEIVANVKGVDLVIPEESWDQKTADIAKYNVDTFAMGDDWVGKFDNLKEHCEVIYLDRTKDVSSTSIKSSLKTFLSISPEEFEVAFKVLNQIKKDLE